MARTSAEKRTLQSKKRRLRNKSFKSYIKTLTKKYAEEKDKEEKVKLLSLLYSALDKAQSKGILHRNTVRRKKRKAALLLVEKPPKTAKAKKTTTPKKRTTKKKSTARTKGRTKKTTVSKK